MYAKPKKKLSQNFLTDKNIQQRIVELCELPPGRSVLEIGAGRGEITRLLAEKVDRLLAIEIDAALIQKLNSIFHDNPRVTVIKKDILHFNFPDYNDTAHCKYTVVGNIPYHISSLIIEKLIRNRGSVDDIFLTVQKEFAQRLCACPGTKSYGSLSCFVQYYTQPSIRLSISKNCFSPRPKVDSCFVHLRIRTEPPVKIRNEAYFFSLIRRSFQQRRKTLMNCLKGYIPIETLQEFMTEANLDHRIRAECLSLEHFAALAHLAENLEEIKTN
jgi:16S rRNA (adenine1518-N6/adenine1519-N6)-dimethyltransferase